MNPLLKNKVDVSSLSEQEKKLFEKYGKLPAKKNALSNMQKERKYFDSGDYAMSKAGVNSEQNVGTAIPTPENLPHASPPSLSSSPTSGSISSPGLHTHASSMSIPPPISPHASGSIPTSTSGSGVGLSSAQSSGSATSPSPSFSTSPSSTQSIAAHHSSSSLGAAGAGSGSGSGLSPNSGFNAGSGAGTSPGEQGVGVGRKASISSMAMGGIAIPNATRGFKSDGARTSPPISFSPLGTSTNNPSSSFPIQNSHSHGQGHHHSSSIGHGNSPVKPSGLAMGMKMKGHSGGLVGSEEVDEMAVDEEDS